MGIFSSLFGEPNPENMSADQMNRYVDSLLDWNKRQNTAYNYKPPDDIKRKIQANQVLIDKAMKIWMRKNREAKGGISDRR